MSDFITVTRSGSEQPIIVRKSAIKLLKLELRNKYESSMKESSFFGFFKSTEFYNELVGIEEVTALYLLDNQCVYAKESVEELAKLLG